VEVAVLASLSKPGLKPGSPDETPPGLYLLNVDGGPKNTNILLCESSLCKTKKLALRDLGRFL
jgi:hypothetical protein